jgi:DNA-binding LytR/AlgR family response regulator
MIKIGIYADSITRNRIKISIVQYLKEVNIKAEISYIKSKDEVINIFDTYNKYNIIIIKRKNKLIYTKKFAVNYGKKHVQIISGSLENPLSNENLSELFFSNNGCGCPHGIYSISTQNTLRFVSHEDIEYFHCSRAESMVFLTNSEAEQINQTTQKIKMELSEDYFVECARGYVVNLFNVKKIDKFNKFLILKSGKEIPLSKKNYQETINKLFKAIFGI